MFKKIHTKLISTFGKSYGECFSSMCMGIVFAISSMNYKSSSARKVELILSSICILNGILWMIYSYKITKNSNTK